MPLNRSEIKALGPEETGCAYPDDLNVRCSGTRKSGSSYCDRHHALCHITLAQRAAAEAEIDAIAERLGGRMVRGDAPPKDYLRKTMPNGRKPRGPIPAWEREFDRRLSGNIIAARHAKGLGSVEVARLIGVESVAYWNWEHGKYRIGAARLQLIADALGVTATSLIPELSDINPCAEGEK
jgi:hypothetical protein